MRQIVATHVPRLTAALAAGLLAAGLAAAQQPAPRQPVSDAGEFLRPVSARDHIRGDPAAPVKVIEFGDTECPLCKRFHPTLTRLVREYPGKVAWVFRHYPIDEIHPKARKEAEATECAAELGGNDKFWAYLDRLYEITPSNDKLDPAELPRIAAHVGLDRAAFTRCLASGRHAARVEEDVDDALAAVAEAVGAPLQLGALASLDGADLTIGHPGAAHDVLVDDAHAVLADGAHAQLGLERDAELADHDDIERRGERGGDLEGDRHAATRQAQHHRRLEAQVPEPCSQATPRLHAIREHRGHLLTVVTLAPLCR